jgi:hypothetical protein
LKNLNEVGASGKRQPTAPNLDNTHIYMISEVTWILLPHQLGFGMGTPGNPLPDRE